jgi:LPS-assembly lipoprotein
MMRRLLGLLLVALSLSSCGFRPLYAPLQNDDGTSVLDTVWISTISGSSGVILRNYLLDGFYQNGYPQTARYLLNIAVQEFSRDVDVQKNDTTTRVQFVARAVYELQDRITKTVVDHGEVRAVSGYNVLLSQYTTVVSQSDARDRALRDIADKIQTRTALVLSEQMDNNGTAP